MDSSRLTKHFCGEQLQTNEDLDYVVIPKMSEMDSGGARMEQD